jgi:hypothetical protein
MNGGKDMKVSTWHLRGAVGALSILVVGFLLGMVTDRVVVAHEGGVGLHAVATGAIHEEAMISFREVLDLEDDQLQQIHEILMRSQGQVDGAWAAYTPRSAGSSRRNSRNFSRSVCTVTC